MNCKHEDVWGDGTTEYCTDCAARTAYFDVELDEWVQGGSLMGKTWTDEGWVNS